jgi:hypothetical protein
VTDDHQLLDARHAAMDHLQNRVGRGKIQDLIQAHVPLGNLQLARKDFGRLLCAPGGACDQELRHRAFLEEAERGRLGLGLAAAAERTLKIRHRCSLYFRVRMAHEHQAFHRGRCSKIRPASSRTLNVRNGS